MYMLKNLQASFLFFSFSIILAEMNTLIFAFIYKEFHSHFFHLQYISEYI